MHFIFDVLVVDVSYIDIQQFIVLSNHVIDVLVVRKDGVAELRDYEWLKIFHLYLLILELQQDLPVKVVEGELLSAVVYDEVVEETDVFVLQESSDLKLLLIRESGLVDIQIQMSFEYIALELENVL